MNTINSQLVHLQNQKINSKNWNISWNLGVFLSHLVKIKNPNCILEVGTSNGFSTLWIANGCSSNSIIYTVDIHEKRLNVAKQNFSICDLRNIKPLLGDILNILKDYNFNEKFDFIFLDALQKDYLKLIQFLKKRDLLSKDCLIVCDNVSSGTKMDDFLKYMNLNFECEFVEIDSGFLVARSKI